MSTITKENLPNVNSGALGLVHGVSRHDVEGLVVFRNIAQRSIASKIVWAVGVDCEHLKPVLLLGIIPPCLSPREEKPLGRSETIDERRCERGRSLAHLAHERAKRQLNPAEICDIFSCRERPIEFLAEHHNLVGLIHHDCFAPLVFLGIFRCPPIAQVTDGVVLAARVVESVRHLVRHNAAKAAELHGNIRFYVEKRSLENRRRKDNFVEQGVLCVFVLRTGGGVNLLSE